MTGPIAGVHSICTQTGNPGWEPVSGDPPVPVPEAEGAMAPKSGSEDLYRSDAYASQNPSLHLGDALWKANHISRLLRRHLPGGNRLETVLETGCGTGVVLRLVSEELSARPIGMDITPSMLVRAREELGSENVIEGSVYQIPVAGKSVDLLLAIDLLEHLTNPALALEEMRRVSGFLVAKVPLEKNLHMSLRQLTGRGFTREKAARKLGHIQSFSASAACRLVEDSGWSICGKEYVSLTAERRWRRGDRKWIKRTLNRWCFHLSPVLNALLFGDFILLLAQAR